LKLRPLPVSEAAITEYGLAPPQQPAAGEAAADEEAAEEGQLAEAEEGAVAEEAEADAVEVATEPEPDEPVEPGDDAGADSFAGGAASTGTHANSFVWSDSTARSSSAANEVTFGAAGNLRVLGGNITQEAFGLLQGERAAVPAAPGAGNGYWWIRNDVPNAFSPTRRIRLGAAAFTV
jgi:hypothetical protein